MVQKGLDSGRLSTILPLAWSLALQHACMQYLPNCNTSNFVLQNYDVNISHTLKLVHMIHGCWLQRAICFQPVVKLFLNLDNQIKFQPPLQLHQLINEMSVSVQCQKSEYPPGFELKTPPNKEEHLEDKNYHFSTFQMWLLASDIHCFVGPLVVLQRSVAGRSCNSSINFLTETFFRITGSSRMSIAAQCSVQIVHLHTI